VLKATFDVLTLERRCVDAALELLVVKISHAAMRVRFLEHHRTVKPLHLGDVGFGKDVCLKINDHYISFKVPGSKCAPCAS